MRALYAISGVAVACRVLWRLGNDGGLTISDVAISAASGVLWPFVILYTNLLQ